MKKLTQPLLRKHIHYNQVTGIMYWLLPTANRVSAGQVVGSLSDQGYWRVSIFGETYRRSRLAWFYMEGFHPIGYEVDHRNRIRHDDSWKNLILKSRPCNAKNCSISHRNSSDIIGVYLYSRDNIWVAEIRYNGKNLYLGRYKSKLDAAKARREAEIKYNYSICQEHSTAQQYIDKKEIIND